MERHHLVTVCVYELAFDIVSALYAFKKPIMSINFHVEETAGDEFTIYLKSTMPVAQEYVHACAGFAAGYRRAWHAGRKKLARFREAIW